MGAETVEILGLPVQVVTYGETLDIIREWIGSGEPHQLATANPEFMIMAQEDAEFRQALKSADLVVADGAGLLWAARVMGQPLPERVTGSDLLPLIARQAAAEGWTIFLLGAAPGTARQTAEVLQAEHSELRVVNDYSGSPSDEESDGIIELVRQARPDILLVAYGAPAQEKWIARYLHELAVPVVIGVGGAFDHIAGVQRRAPVWVQNLHLEWLFRLVTQPWRWRRQLALPKFAWAVLRSRWQS
ncbi:MAG: WecB/TagA/CpsF family glycosyltransferase [Chloroflexota bacterium]|nr:WecB/TagA/CpsF family glycosyltransferase [Chloroflexota bacterium]